MTPDQTARAHELLVQLENSEAFAELIVKPYAAYADGALRRAIAEARKPAGPMAETRQGEHADPSRVRNPQIVCDLLRDHVIYKEVATLVSGQLASIRLAQAKRELAASAGQKDLPENYEQA